MDRVELRRARFTHISEQANARWARQARAAGDTALARVHEQYARGRTVAVAAGGGFRTVPAEEVCGGREPAPIHSTFYGGFIAVAVTSFGYRHAAPPLAELTVDVRRVLHDPHVDPALRELTGLYPVVRRHVLATPGAAGLVEALVPAVGVLLSAATAGRQHYVVRVAIGCAGGRHRSVVLANELVGRLIGAGIGAEVEHRDILRPVLPPDGGNGDDPQRGGA